MQSLEKAEKILTRLLEGIASVCLLVILVLIVTLVTLRYVFNAGIVGANEFATILFVYTPPQDAKQPMFLVCVSDWLKAMRVRGEWADTVVGPYETGGFDGENPNVGKKYKLGL